jgi:hypothetical protein
MDSSGKLINGADLLMASFQSQRRILRWKGL